MQNLQSRWKYLIAVVFVAIVCLRLFVDFKLSGIPLFYDQPYYNADALRFLNGEKFVSQWPPGLPLYLAGIYYFAGVSSLIGHLGMFALGLLSLLLVYLLSVQLGLAKRTAIIAVLLMGAMPGSFYYTGALVTQTPTAILLCIMALFLLKDRESGGQLYLALASASCGLLTLMRAGGIFLFPVLLILGLYGRKSIVKRSLLATLPFSVIVGMWVAHLWLLSGKFIFINTYNTYNLFVGNNPFMNQFRTWELAMSPELAQKASHMIPGLLSMNASQQEAAYFHTAIKYIISRPDLFFFRVIARSMTFWAFDTNAGSTILRLNLLSNNASVFFLAADAVANLFVILLIFISPVFMKINKKFLVPFLLAFGYMSQFLLAFSHPSYHYPVLVLLAPIAAGTLSTLMSLGAKESYEKIKANRTGVILIAFFIIIQATWVYSMSNRFHYL